MRGRSKIVKKLVWLLPTLLFTVPPCAASIPGNGKLNGTVIDTTSAVVKGAKVVATNRATAQKNEVTTNNDGKYEFSELEEGGYDLKVTAPGFKKGERSSVIVSPDQTTTEDFTLEPRPTGAVRGFVTDAQGAAIADAMITALDEETGDIYTATTDDDGQYELSVPLGRYNLLAEFSGFARAMVTDVKVTADSAQTVNITLGPNFVITNPDLVRPSRPTVAKPAEFQVPGILQVEFGYDANFRSSEAHDEQVAPLTVRFAPTERLLVDASLDTLISRTPEPGRPRRRGVGDTRLEFQVLAAREGRSHPALAYAYGIKLPSASVDKVLGNGRVDHKVAVLLSKKFRQTSLDFNGALLFVGREGAAGWTKGALGALALSRKFGRLGLTSEVSWQSTDYRQRRGVFGLGALTYQVNPRLVFDGGARFGLSPGSPRAGVFAGFTVGLGKPFKRP